MIVRVLAEADGDLYSAAARLEARTAGIGFRLVSDYKLALVRMEAQPHLYPLVDDPIPSREFRNALILRASYRVIYEVRADECVVLSVIDSRRRPGIWHSRILDV